MRPNLSVEKLSAALAVLGATALIGACGGGDTKPPVNANEVAPSGEKKAGDGHCGADAKHDKDQAACSAAKGAGSCGAGKGAGSCGAKAGDSKPTDTSATAAPSDAKPADPKAGDTKAADSKGTTATPAPSASASATASGKKPAPPPAGGKKGGASGCGAGTCSAKK